MIDRADLHGGGGAVSETADGVVGAVGVLEGGGERDPAREVAVTGDGEGPLERADACQITSHYIAHKKYSNTHVTKVNRKNTYFVHNSSSSSCTVSKF